MKKLVAIWGLVCVLGSARAQMGNEWIDFGQAYYKIPVGKTGIHRLDHNTLQAAGFPVGSVNPKTLRLYHRGTEQAIYVAGEADDQLDPADFIEFYGVKNDGTRDADLYKIPTHQPHPYYNLYSDTTAYFLTYGAGNGKRMVLFSETNTGGLPAETFHHDEKQTVLTDDYAYGNDFGIEVLQTAFDLGEGWTGPMIVQNQFREYTLSGIANGATAAGLPQLQLQLMGRGVMTHRVEVYVGAALRLLTTVDFNGYQTHTATLALAWSDISAGGDLLVRVRTIGTGSADRVSVSYITLRYPQQTNAAGAAEKIFNLPENAGDKSYMEIQNPVAGLRLFDVTDPGNVVRIGTTSSATLNAVVPHTAAARKILCTSVVTVPAIRAVAFRQIIPASHDYIIISHPLLRRPASGYDDPVKAYGAYRASEAGGGYDTLVVNIGQLYDQFNDGEPSPRAIFQFMKYLAASHVPRYLFIIGKGLDVDHRYYRNPALYSQYKDLVPTAGLPGSDMYFTAGLAGTTDDPAVATGRITAMHPEQVAAYLDKVKETEARPFDDLSRKHLLHLSGGIEEGEPELFRSYMEDFASVAKSYYLGGKISAIAKRSTDITLINIADEVNKGLGMVTFFGHSSPSTLDFDIGYVTDPVMGYNNPGKYPMMVMNGCNAGAFFLNDLLFGEDWILARNKGATGFIAHSAYGLVSNLRLYSETLYRVAFGDSTYIHKGIGDVQKETARRYVAAAGSSPANTSQIQQMVLLGDPAVSLFGARRPDLETNNSNVSIESLNGEPVTALTDSFALKIIVRNFGQARKDTLQIAVRRFLNDNTVLAYDSLFSSTLYSDTLQFVIRKGRENGGGNNRFEIALDPDNVIDELQENNNGAVIEFPMPSNGTKNIYPAPFAIVHTRDLQLALQTTDLLSDERSFLVELDTVQTFDSPFRKTFTVQGTVLARQAIALLDHDSLAYYWRTKLAEPQPEESAAWTSSSFTYIENGPEGWAQVHFPQYLDNATIGLLPDAPLRTLRFKETVAAVDIITYGGAHPSVNRDVSVKINGAEYNLYTQSGGGFGCRENTINLIAFDRSSTVPYIGIPFKWYNRLERACGREPWVINSFTYSELITGNNDDITAYVNNIAPGDSVVLFSIGNALWELWPAAAKAKLGELGISVAQLNALQPSDPVVIFARKGLAPGDAKIFIATDAPANAQPLEVHQTITGRYTSGTMTSAWIGPAQAWQSFVADTRGKEPQDAVVFDIVGRTLAGEEDVLFAGLSGDQDLSAIDAEAYPYLSVVYKTTDDVNLTAVQLRQWLVLYTPVAEGLLVYQGRREQEVFSEGQTWSGAYGFINISDKVFTDSLTVRREVFNQQQRLSDTDVFRIKAPAPGDTTHFTVDVSTAQREGLNDVQVFVNPRVLPEQYYDNNVLALPGHLNVTGDLFSPVMDVTIDARHVTNGDFVSPQPLIAVRLWDENGQVLKTDPAGMRIFLTYPCANDPCDPTPVELAGPHVTWQPATPGTDFRLEFRPAHLAAGTYTLRVEAEDARANASGTEPYQISFVVSDEITVSLLPAHPNPSETDVYFTLVLGGDHAPEYFHLEIVDIQGRLVHAQTPDASGFHIGTNTVTWDGAGSGGATLPKGMYFYTIRMVVDGRTYHQQGKLVRMR